MELMTFLLYLSKELYLIYVYSSLPFQVETSEQDNRRLSTKSAITHGCFWARAFVGPSYPGWRGGRSGGDGGEESGEGCRLCSDCGGRDNGAHVPLTLGRAHRVRQGRLQPHVGVRLEGLEIRRHRVQPRPERRHGRVPRPWGGDPEPASRAGHAQAPVLLDCWGNQRQVDPLMDVDRPRPAARWAAARRRPSTRPANAPPPNPDPRSAPACADRARAWPCRAGPSRAAPCSRLPAAWTRCARSSPAGASAASVRSTLLCSGAR